MAFCHATFEVDMLITRQTCALGCLVSITCLVIAVHFLKDANTNPSADISTRHGGTAPDYKPLLNRSASMVNSKETPIVERSTSTDNKKTKPEILKPSKETDAMSMDLREEAINEWDEQHAPPEPDDFNYDAYYGGPFEDQVNLYSSDDECMENCAEVLNEQVPSDGEFSDQVNSDDLLSKAQQEGLMSAEASIPLLDPDESTGPPTDIIY